VINRHLAGTPLAEKDVVVLNLVNEAIKRRWGDTKIPAETFRVVSFVVLENKIELG
jgi:hypothetical protein